MLYYIYICVKKKKGLKNIQIVAYQVRNQGYQVYLCICVILIFFIIITLIPILCRHKQNKKM